MTPSPYQAASNQNSLNPTASDRDTRRSAMDWPENRAQAAGQVVGADVVGPVIGGREASSPSPSTTVAGNEPDVPPLNDAAAKLAMDLNLFNEVAKQLRESLVPAKSFKQRCHQAFDIANDLFGNSPTWVCFYRELLASGGMLYTLFSDNGDYEAFQRSDQYRQIQGMLTGLRGRDLPENDPNDPQRMITVRLPKSLHEAMCDEALRLNISINKLCISRMLQMLDPTMIPETTSKPRGRKPRTQSSDSPTAQAHATSPTSGNHVSGNPASGNPASGNHPAAAHPQPGSNHSADGSSSRVGFEFTSILRRP